MTIDEKIAVAKKLLKVMQDEGVTLMDLYSIENYFRDMRYAAFPAEPYSPKPTKMEITNTEPLEVHLT